MKKKEARNDDVGKHRTLIDINTKRATVEHC